jgi:hypothetical protein
VTTGGAILAALLVTLATPATWPLALATFLIRGGIVVVLLPIVVLPTAVGLGNVLGPPLQSVAFGTIPVELIAGVGVAGIALLAWLVGGGWLAAASEAHGAWIVGRKNDVSTVAASPPGGSVALRILAARLIAAIPFAVVLAVGSVRLVFVTYRELTAPVDVATPIVVRVLRATPEVVIAVVLTWMLAEVVGAVAARRIALADARIGHALRSAGSTLLRQPVGSLVRFWLPTVVLIAIAVPAALAAGSSWEAVGSALGGDAEPVESLLTVLVFVALWVVGLMLIGVVCAWRAAVWTVAHAGR